MSSRGRNSCTEQIIQEILTLSELSTPDFLASSMLADAGLTQADYEEKEALREDNPNCQNQTAFIAQGTMPMTIKLLTLYCT